MKTAGPIDMRGIRAFIARLMERSAVIAPVIEADGEANLLPVSRPEEVSLDHVNTVNSPKEFLFPCSQELFSFTGNSHGSIRPPGEPGETVLFGVRPCDASAIRLMDAFFGQKFQDGPYRALREKTAVVVIACRVSGGDCFCSSMGTGPVMEKGFDIQLVPREDGFYIYTDSEKGEELARLADPEGSIRDGALSLPDTSGQMRRVDAEKAYRSLKKGLADRSLWEDTAFRCQRCGMCLFICPTCTCFTVLDETAGKGLYRRVRRWDCGYFRGFTRLAGGHNPVRHEQDMVKRKYLHKIVQQKDEFGMYGCTGCGRCTSVCPGNVDWQKNLGTVGRGDVQ